MKKHTDTTNAVTPEPPIERAERMATSHKAAAWKLIRLVRGPVEDLFGHTVAEALLPVIEIVTENADEAMYHFREALDEAREQALRESRYTDHLARQRDHVLNLLREAVADADRRHKRRGTDPPEWVTRARSAIRTPSSDLEPF